MADFHGYSACSSKIHLTFIKRLFTVLPNRSAASGVIFAVRQFPALCPHQ
jgi:hypothetical protein